ncbi:pro-corazonin-like [Pseudomyrmex gracilis]|uniref:pro-corazonin-like n=1 Tax=Pseudomyrmex gracilis TaxID=219809 RepID=UPI000994EEE2|nr:pro-corazonin-like [Pseudomyrmex gracilis]XP_020291607.1 pro-corazonin-like [Pseudomyrmex gracilis]
MANKCIFILLVLSLVISIVLCQTFQYSHGWTNGKRFGFSNSAEISNPGDVHLTSGDVKRLKMLLHGNVDDQPLLIQCDLMNKLKKLIHTNNYALQLRREKMQNDENY